MKALLLLAALAAPAAAARDLTAELASALASPGAPVDCSPYRVLLIKGFLGDHIEDYMERTRRRLRELGCEADFVPVATEGGWSRNLELIGERVAASPKPVILLGHSRGGMMTHDWFRAAAPELKGKVAKAVLLQAPLAGSEVADELYRRKARFAAILLGIKPAWRLSEVFETLRGLGTDARRAALAALPPLEPADAAKLLCVYSSYEPRGDEHLDMRLGSAIIASADDGLVSVRSARLDGVDSAHLPGFDHEDTVLQDPGWYKRLKGSRPRPEGQVARVAEALLRLALMAP